MNWTPGNIFNVRGKKVIDQSGRLYDVEFYADGWKVGNFERLDIWAACRVLNDMNGMEVA